MNPEPGPPDEAAEPSATGPDPVGRTGSSPVRREIPRTDEGSHAAKEDAPTWVVSSDPDASLDPQNRRSRRRISLEKNGSAANENDDEHGRAVARWRRSNDKRVQKKKRPFWVELPILVLIAFALTFVIQTFIAKVYYVPSASMEKTLHGVETGGDRILASKIVYDFRDPHQGDVVVFKGPDTWAAEADIPGPSSWVGKVFQSLGSVIGIAPANEKDFVKRVIAVGGQTISCCDAQGNMVVDGHSLSEPYIYEPFPFTAGDPTNDCTKSSDGLFYSSQRCFDPIKVPAGQLWVMGDHRSDSADSFYDCRGRTTAGQAQWKDTNGADCGRPIPQNDVIGKAVFIVMPPSRWQTIGDPDIDPAAGLITGPAAYGAPAAGGVGLTLLLRGGLALTPARRRRRRARRR